MKLSLAGAAVVLLGAALFLLPRLDEERARRFTLFEEELRASSDHFVCAGYGYIDRGAAHDGPAYYFLEDSRTLVSECGGACMGGGASCLFLCPPGGWKAQGCDEKYHAWLSQKQR